MPMLRWNGIQPVEKGDLVVFEPLVRAVKEAVTASPAAAEPAACQ